MGLLGSHLPRPGPLSCSPIGVSVSLILSYFLSLPLSFDCLSLSLLLQGVIPAMMLFLTFVPLLSVLDSLCLCFFLPVPSPVPSAPYFSLGAPLAPLASVGRKLEPGSDHTARPEAARPSPTVRVMDPRAASGAAGRPPWGLGLLGRGGWVAGTALPL